MASISELKIGMSVATKSFEAGMSRSREALKQLDAKVTSTQNALSSLGTALAAVGAAGAALGTLRAAFGAAAGLKDLVLNSIDAVDSTAELASRLGVTTKALTQLQYAAQLTGTDAGAVGDALQKLNVNLGQAADKATPAAKALERLGLDAKTLAARGPAEAFKAIAEGISKLPTPAEKASAAVALFGKQGALLLNTLNAGKGRIDELAAEADRLGISLSGVDVAKAGAAQDAIDRLSYTLTGLKNRLAVELAPVVEVVATKFTDLLTEGELAGVGIRDAIGSVGEVIGGVADAVEQLRREFLGVQATLTDVTATALEGLHVLDQAKNAAAVVGSSGLLGGGQPGGDVLGEQAGDVRALAERQAARYQEALKSALPSERLRKFWEEAGAEVDAAAAAQAGGTGPAADVFRAPTKDEEKTIRDATRAEEKAAAAEKKRMADQAAKEKKRLAAAAAERKRQLDADVAARDRIVEETETPKEKYDKALAEAMRLKGKGLLGQETFDRRVDQLRKERDEAEAEGGRGMRDLGPRFAGAIELGSREAYSTIIRNRFGGVGGDGLKDLAKTNRDQLDELRDLPNKLATALAREIPRFEVMSI